MKVCVLSLLAMLLPLLAQAQQISATSEPVLAAKSYVLYDYSSNQILVEHNGEERMEPASLTKLMTAYLTFNALKLNQLALAQSTFPTEEALRAQGQELRMFLDPSKSVTIGELLRGLMVQSGNDAARVLATVVAGNEADFAELMNKEAQRLNMKNTHFVNATGVPHAQHYSTARDLVLLATAIVRDFPEHYALYGMRIYQYNNVSQSNRNRLLWMDPFVDGMGTGYSERTGFSLVASAQRDQRRLISVVLGAPSDNLRATESQKLLNYGFQNFEARRLYQKNQAVASIRLWKGTENKVPVGFRNDLLLTIPKGQMAQLKATMETQQPLFAPISGGQKISVLKLNLNGKPYAEFPLVALDAVPLANVFSRGWDSIRLLFQ
ncbi:MAG: D-alanyl-D-alanine carboxypeptidase family protein [Gallionellaceae bacterium]|nr:D-alanyl-D-alanine carboxypeptidase family protein [Gallionellaceae bacterium]